MLITVNDYDKGGALKIARDLHRLGFDIYATAGTGGFIYAAGTARHDYLERAQAAQQAIPRLDAMRDGKIQLIINTPLGRTP